MAEIHDPMPPAHYVTHTYVAMCSCGWAGEPRRHLRVAEEDLSIHQNNSKEIAS